MVQNSAAKTNSTTLDRTPIDASYRVDETQAAQTLLTFVDAHQPDSAPVKKMAEDLITAVRQTPRKTVAIENFLSEFGLTTPEGIALMCLAEALLRVPDAATANKLIEDKLSSADWDKHVKTADDLFLSLSSWALMTAGNVMAENVIDEDRNSTKVSGKSTLGKMVKRMGEPVIRQAMLQAMKILGQQFVMGQTIEDAIKRAAEWEKKGYRYSYDMLGEGARTHEDAERYFATYAMAIEAIGQAAVKSNPNGSPMTRAGISVKLSALHPKYSFANRAACVPALSEKLKTLALACQKYNIGLTVDAEEANRLDVSLDIIENVFLDPDLRDWDGFGLAVQAYQKRAFYVIDWLADLSKRGGKRMMVRLVKGAYWDSEIKYAQIEGLSAYPVYTRKAMTDLSYNACAIKLMQHKACFYPQLATHNAFTAASVLSLARSENHNDFEFQRLHGMGEPLYETITEQHKAPCRIYAPVGTHKDLLPYLVRRMLENGANSSFVHQILDETIPVQQLSTSPAEQVRALKTIPHPKIALPRDLYGTRVNSAGFDTFERNNETHLTQKLAAQKTKTYTIGSIIDGKTLSSKDSAPITNPADKTHSLGTMHLGDTDSVERAIDAAEIGFKTYRHTTAEQRALWLEAIADNFEAHRDELIGLCVFEAGKTWKDAVDELREAVDFCSYYAEQGRAIFGAAKTLKGPTGEENTLSYHPRGVWACISPWNFPLAIFTGQVVAALMAGNTVLAKPAEQTGLVAYRAVQLMHKAGIPENALHLIIGKGRIVGPVLTADERVAGFAFTGSTAVAKQLQREIAAREGAIIPLIAETGGQNAMIVDNTALPEQVVDDVIRSAFGSAGQRCSALRVLFLQDEIAPTIIHMLKGAMQELVIANPQKPSTDIGPVIDERALSGLLDHIKAMKQEGTLIHACAAPNTGSYCAPHAFEIPSLKILTEEIFGPILHVIRYKGDELHDVLQAIADTGYGLTLGIHSRIDFAVDDILSHVHVGNIYVNRGMTGAVVGVQPFGGEGLSGTGPKAGGPTYLYRFATERSLSVNTTAAGGNASLISMNEDE